MNVIERFWVIAKIILVSHLFLLSGCYFRYSVEDLDPKSNGKPLLKIQKESMPSQLNINEGSTLVIYLVLSAASNQTNNFTVQLEGSQGESVGAYFDLTQSSFTIPAGETTAHLSIIAIDDIIYHSDSQWTLKLVSTSTDIDASDTLSFTLKDNDSNSSLAPTAVLAGLPSNPSNSLSFNVSVSGTNLATYQYKLGPSASTFCNMSTGYSSDLSSSSPIIENLGVYSDGQLTLCVIGKDASGNFQPYASATTHTWTKDTVAPTAVLTGAPTGTNGTKNLNISVDGTAVVSYQYKVGVTGSTDCTLSTGYSSDVLVNQNITTDITVLADGSITLCVLGKDSAGNLQAAASSTTATWTKDTVAPTITSVSSALANGAYSAGVNIDIEIIFSKIVNVASGTPTLDLNSHVNAKASYLSGSGSTTLVFRYTVGALDSASDLEYPLTTSLSLAGSTILDNYGNAANLSLPVIGEGSSLGSLKNIQIDTTNPTAPNTLADGTWSNSTSQTPNLTFVSGTDGGSGIARHEVKLIDHTNADVDVTSFVTLISNNPVTGLTLATGVNYRIVVRAVDNAGNYSTEAVSDGWTVDTVAPTTPGAVTVGSVPALFKQQTPTFTFTDSTDALSGRAFYQLEIRKSSDNSVVKAFVAATGDGTGLSYNEGADLLTGEESYYANIRAVDNAGNTSAATQSGNWVALQCPTNFIAVPARSPYTTLPFCVSKFEMKLQYNGSIITDGNASNTHKYDADYETPAERAKYVAVSDPSGKPWVYIKRGENGAATGQGAIEACQSLGAGYDLISNAQWQTIAQDVELTASNWTSGVVGTEMMYRGHSDNNSSTSLSVTNINDGYDQTDNNSGEAWGSGKEQRRTFTLSNGEVVWDMAGNVYEWVKDNNTTMFETGNWISQLLSSNGISGTVGGLTGNAKYLFGPSGNYSSLNTGQYGGLGYGGVNWNTGTVIRGGYWFNTMGSGVFNVNLSLALAAYHNFVGFRCVFQ